LILRADGSAEYITGSERKIGRLHVYSFLQLAHAAEEIGYFDLEARYACSVTDNPTVYVSVMKNGARKIIEHYSPDSSGPVRLLMFEHFIDRAYQEVAWETPPQ
jgi:hypothetical protein